MAAMRADILIVDDLPSNLTALEAILEGLGQEIVRAPSGQEALRVLYDREFAVILLDVRMPDLDGIETAKFIRQGKRSKHTPIIFITAGDDDVEAVARGYSVGAVDYIRKPIQAEILRSKVRVFVEFHVKKAELALRAEELARANEEIRTAYKQLETFSYTLAHDLRAPLRAMAGFSQILKEEYSDKVLDQTGQDYASRIEKGAREMDVLIQELLSYCQVAHTKVDLVPLGPGSIVRDVLARKPPTFHASVDVSVAASFPRVVGDRGLLDHAIANLVSNAIRFAKPGKRPQVRIKPDAGERTIRLWVEDEGIGIAPEHHDRIFKTFERLNERSEFPGAGMGLAMVKTAVERMGGRVGLESRVGEGSRFWIELPRCDDA